MLPIDGHAAEDASGFLKESLEIDPLYMGCLYEQAAGKPESDCRLEIRNTFLYAASLKK